MINITYVHKDNQKAGMFNEEKRFTIPVFRALIDWF